jgi:hypothetical protein
MTILLTLLLCGAALAADKPPVAAWSFDRVQPGDEVRGYSKSVPGIVGQGLRFDGQTTSVVRRAAEAPKLDGAFTIEAWVAVQTYPWTWCAVANQEKDRKSGYFFGIDPEGRIGLHLALGGAWREVRSEAKLPLYRWNHIVGTFDSAEGIKLFCNGELVGSKPLQGKPSYASGSDLWIGRNLTPLDLSEEVKVVAQVAYSFDGILDEVKLYDHVLGPAEVSAAFTRHKPSGPAPLAAPALPSGPPGPGRFGAYYTRLRFAEEWERPWRVGEAADVVVRFDETPNRLVFWRGTSFIPAWVTENGIWYTNEFFETQSGAMPTSAEPMADKQARLSHARILESNEARVVVLWRYAPVALNYDLVHVDQLTGWGDWVEETFTVYPDGICIRKIRVWSSNPRVDPNLGLDLGNFRQFHEAIIINPPGTRPEDNIKPEALTLANMKGETETYSWAKEAPGFPADYDEATLKVLHRISDLATAQHKWLTKPRGGNILRVNLKAVYSPYVVIDPREAAIDCYAGEIIRERSMFPWWNHWPVSQQIRSNGRWAVAPDRPSHSSLAHIQSWRPFEESEDGITMLMLNGLTDKPAAGLLPLAKSWLSPPSVEVLGGAFQSEGFDPTERAFRLVRRKGSPSGRLEVRLNASQESPVVNPVLVVRNWGPSGAAVEVDGRPAVPGREARVGLVPGLERDDLVVWVRADSSKPLRIALVPTGGSGSR